LRPPAFAGIVARSNPTGAPVFTTYIGLVALILITPASMFADDSFAAAIVGLLAATVAAIASQEIRPGEAAHLARVARRKWPIALIPAAFLVLQLSPWPATGLSRSIWDTAAQALGRSLWPSITIDPGATVLALGRYLCFLATVAVAAAISIDRARAEHILLVLVGVCCAVAWILIGHDIGGFASLGPASGPRAAMVETSVLGAVFAACAVVLTVERYETRHQRGQISWNLTVALLGAAVVALLSFAAALALSGMGHAQFAAACGLVTVAIIVLVRRLGLGPWAAAFLSAAAAIAVVAVVASRASPPADATLRYAAAPSQLVAMTGRMLGDIGWAGTGAGTFHALAPIYLNVDPSGTISSNAPTFAAKLVIETGRASLWGFIGLMAALVALMVRGALSRGRDSFYAMAAAAAGVATLVEAFGDAGLSNSGVSILVAAAFGLGLSQSVSRTA
jgi:hypothetical protein